MSGNSGFGQYLLTHLETSFNTYQLPAIWNAQQSDFTIGFEDYVCPLLPFIYIAIAASLNGYYWKLTNASHRKFLPFGRLGNITRIYHEPWSIIRQCLYTAYFIASFLTFLLPTVLLQLSTSVDQEVAQYVLSRRLGSLLLALSAVGAVQFHHKDTCGFQMMSASKKSRLRILQCFWSGVSVVCVIRLQTSARRLLKTDAPSWWLFIDLGCEIMLSSLAAFNWLVTCWVKDDQREDAVTLLAETFLSEEDRVHSDRTELIEAVVQLAVSDKRRDSPEEQINFLQSLWFTWITPLIYKGNQKLLEFCDIWSLPPDVQSSVTYARFMHGWHEELQKPIDDYTLLRSLARFVSPTILYSAGLKIVYDTMLVLDPMLLNLVVKFMMASHSDNPPSRWRGAFYVFLMSINSIMQTVFSHQYFQKQFSLGFKIRSALSTAVYSKALSMNKDSMDPEFAEKMSSGQLINLMSVDVQRLQDLMTYVHILWSSPYQLSITAFLLWRQLGSAAFAGILTMMCAIPLTKMVTGRLKRLQKELMVLKDHRIKLVEESFSGIKAVKLYAWEEAQKKVVNDARAAELAKLWKIQTTNVGFRAQANGIPCIVAIVSFFFYTWALGNKLTPAVAFTSLALFNNLRFPMQLLPNLILQASEALITVERLQRFLLIKDLRAPIYKALSPGEPSLEAQNLTLGYPTLPSILRNINLKIAEGAFVAIVGKTGIGKTSLAKTFVGNLEPQAGVVIVRGSQAYCSQTAWIQTGTIKENILFGELYDEDRYQQTLEACALVADLQILPDGDETEIGEKGVNLSGGQKQRIALARAVYKDADTYVLDDIMSAVDTHVAEHIFRKVLKGILQGKTILLVTHRYEFLADVDQILLLSDGQIRTFSTLHEAQRDNEFVMLSARGDTDAKQSQPLKSFSQDSTLDQTSDRTREQLFETSAQPNATPPRCDMTAHPSRRCLCTTSSDGSSMDTEHSDAEGPPCEGPRLTPCRHASKLVHRLSQEEFDVKSKKSVTVSYVAPQLAGKARRSSLIQEERVEIGAVSYHVYNAYFKACGGGVKFALFIVSTIAMGQMITVGANFWLSYWSEHSDPSNPHYVSSGEGLAGYALSTTLYITALVTASFCVALGAQRAAYSFHSQLLNSLVHATVRFFETCPLGRIINRFSKDLYAVDEAIPNTLYAYCNFLITVILVGVVVTFVIPLLFFVILPMCYIFYRTQTLYVNVARQLRRIDSILRSPVFSHFTETIDGAGTIRAFQKCSHARLIHFDRLDANLSAAYLWVASNRWLATRLESMGTVLVGSVAFMCVMASGILSAALSGLAISYAINVVSSLTWLVRLSGDREASVIAVERIVEYLDPTNCPQEDYTGEEHFQPMQSDTQYGLIQFDDVGVRYRPKLPFAIRHINIEILPGEKVAIVGRTGAGKSTFMSCLFRMVDLTEGHIKIDGVDISKVAVNEVRSTCSVIPQDSTIFSGTIRSNLDPFHEKSDEEVWKALDQACLKTFVESLPNQLDAIITENGSNLSGGQRQLLCLARVCLRTGRVLLLDEATSALDPQTDATIQETIRRDFKHLTVVTIAHRIKTILDYDKIIVMDDGAVAECGKPDDLLSNPNSHFSKLAQGAI